jgi:hypothetical protein
VQEGPEGILLNPIGENLSNYERGMSVFCCTQQEKPMAKQDIQSGVNLRKVM